MKVSASKLSQYKLEIANLKKRLLYGGTGIEESNIATIYRMAGNNKRAFQWWKRAAVSKKDGDAFLELAFCYQYGIGVRKNIDAARDAYLTAIRSKFITPYDREEALYHLAILYLDIDTSSRSLVRAKSFLVKASTDKDYPAADRLLESLKYKDTSQICRCRRFLDRAYGGKDQCALHRRAL